MATIPKAVTIKVPKQPSQPLAVIHLQRTVEQMWDRPICVRAREAAMHVQQVGSMTKEICSAVESDLSVDLCGAPLSLEVSLAVMQRRSLERHHFSRTGTHLAQSLKLLCRHLGRHLFHPFLFRLPFSPLLDHCYFAVRVSYQTSTSFTMRLLPCDGVNRKGKLTGPSQPATPL